MSKNKSSVSPETINEAHKIAKATQRPGQTKEQTKLIEKGIQKGIAEYKKRQKSKARELDKKLKQAKRAQDTKNAEMQNSEASELDPVTASSKMMQWIPWLLLIISWLAFGVYFFNP